MPTGNGSGDSVAVLRVGHDQRVTSCNDVAPEILGVPRAELVGRPIATVPRAGDASVWSWTDGSTLYVIAPEGARPMRPGGWTDARLDHLSRLANVGQLVASVVHEVNNALAGIVGYSQLAAQSAPSGAPETRDIAMVHEEALRTSRVLENLLRFSRANDAAPTTIDLSELLTRCVRIKERDFRLHSVQTELAISGSVPTLSGNEALIVQVFLNLLENAKEAIRSCHDAGVVRIHARRRAGAACIDITDSGPGVPRAQRTKIFDPFFTTREAGAGTGLGLPFSRRIVEQTGGSLRLVRKRGGGATFRVVLPAAVDAPVARTQRARPVQRQRVEGRHIVVIEDEPSVRDFVCRAFIGHGNHLTTFQRGEDALTYLQQESVDLVISDMRRPGMDGETLYRNLVQLRPAYRSRFLFITGDVVSATTDEFLRRTGAPSLRKPVTLDELLEAAATVLRAPPDEGPLFESAAGR